MLAAAAAPADYAWQPHLGAVVPLTAPLRDTDGAPTTLGAALAARPAILDLGYFRCPSLCGVARHDLLAALRQSGLAPDGYSLVALSIDPREAPAVAQAAKAAELAEVPGADASSWHYLTGTADAIAPVTRAVGFPTRYDDALAQFLHPTGLVILTPGGRVSAYLQGVGYSGGELRAAVLRAGGGGVAQAALPILLLCFHFDAATGRYTLAIEKLIRLAGVLTVLTLGGMLLLLHRKRPAA